MTCGSCHFDDANYAMGTTVPGRLPNAHDQHVADFAAGGRNYVCSACHPSGGYSMSHQAGFVNVAVSGTLGVMKHLAALEKKGYLRRSGDSRGIVLIGQVIAYRRRKALENPAPIVADAALPRS